MKKYLFIFMSVFMLLGFGGVASADMADYPELPTGTYEKTFLIVGTELVVWNTAPPKIYVNMGMVTSNGGPFTSYALNGDAWTLQGTYTEVGSSDVKEGNANVYSSSGSETIFFTAPAPPPPPPPPTPVDSVTELLPNLTSQVGLMLLWVLLPTLALMLGVLYLPRLLRWFSR